MGLGGWSCWGTLGGCRHRSRGGELGVERSSSMSCWCACVIQDHCPYEGVYGEHAVRLLHAARVAAFLHRGCFTMWIRCSPLLAGGVRPVFFEAVLVLLGRAYDAAGGSAGGKTCLRGTLLDAMWFVSWWS